MKLKNIKRLDNYPDILSLEDVRSILNVRTKKTAARWLQSNGIFYFRIGREYKIPKVHLMNYFSNVSSIIPACDENGTLASASYSMIN